MKLVSKDNLDSAKWDEFVCQNASDGGFLQSSGWGKFQESTGRKVYYLGFVDESGKIVATALLVKHKLFLGMGYWYSPRGPVIAKDYIGDEAVFNFIVQEVKRISERYAMLFWRLDPAWQKDQSEILRKLGFKKVGQVQPAKTLILDLKLSEKELLAQMKSKTRYNIKVANKHGVEIVTGTEKDFEEFWQMMTSTTLRDGIKAHSKGYYQKMLQMGGFKLSLARWQGKPCAGAIMAYFGDWCVYLHGASAYEMRDKMAPYALQWEMILDAQKRGFKHYDFFGVDEAKWPGVTRFKVGFAPEKPFTEFVGAYDFVYDKFWYWAYKVVRQFV
jgi:lipid II:glycine glycyltransferase (peptidoglycan interpeptide bridge formation enzyme)